MAKAFQSFDPEPLAAASLGQTHIVLFWLAAGLGLVFNIFVQDIWRPRR